MRRVLIVSPRFPPINAPDCQRVRMMLADLADNGWEAVVLAVDPNYVEAPMEADLLLTIPNDIRVVRCKAISQRAARVVSVGSLGLRSFRCLRRAGDALLADGGFDLVFFSTTEFEVVPLGRRWKKRFGIPFVVDIQDPWVNDYYVRTGNPPPGGVLKHRVMQALARTREGPTLKEAAHVIAVSPAYPDELRKRYPELPEERFTTIPFGGSLHDFAVADQTALRQRIFDPSDGRTHWVYAGTAPPGIRLSLSALLLALRRAFDDRLIDPELLRLHFIGTDYARAQDAQERIRPIARELGFDQTVIEWPSRIPYLETLRCLRDANALLVLGWDDPGYTASKIYPNILAERPLLTVLHERSSANTVTRDTGAGVAVT